MTSFFQELTEEQLSRISSHGANQSYPAKERIFSEGDEAEHLYRVVSGRASIFIEKFNTRMELQDLGPGDWFGEMALFNGNRRTASAAATDDTVLLAISRQDFMGLLDREPEIAAKVHGMVNQRNEQLVLKEKLIDADGVCGRDVHIGIKGDPSLRESAMMRERYESVVDKLMPELVACFEELLLNRTAYRIFIGFNNGEVRISTVLDPFSEEFHPAQRLVDPSYIDRHFPRIDYERKAGMIRRVHDVVRQDTFFAELPAHLHNGYERFFGQWRPMQPEEIRRTLSQFPLLRDIPNFYVRNVTIGILKDAIHMQFNCDGTHIVSAAGYERFLAENL